MAQARACIWVFIVVSTLVFVLIGSPTLLLVFAGAINAGWFRCFALGIVLVAATTPRPMRGYRHRRWRPAGWGEREKKKRHAERSEASLPCT